ncbi:MAG: formylglycine-generating enzyme family protein, partial [Helicobacteraceae bacterium]|nr:formylglycine-generating enzyme family protein [Helicobacteraceae bacterium]
KNTASGIELKLINGGSFTMGADDYEAEDTEKPPHLVTITQPYYIGIYEVTKTQWRAVMGGDRGNAPVTNVSWEKIAGTNGFIRKLNADAGTIVIGGTIYEYALPSEAQWEFAARGGMADAYSWGSAQPGAFAWYAVNAALNTHTTGLKWPNGYGLFDTSGNAAEWVYDCYVEYESDSASDPLSSADCVKDRIVRGGSYEDAVDGLRVTRRVLRPKTYSDGTIGFRLALTPKR